MLGYKIKGYVPALKEAEPGNLRDSTGAKVFALPVTKPGKNPSPERSLSTESGIAPMHFQVGSKSVLPQEKKKRKLSLVEAENIVKGSSLAESP